jgi:hypothetical protein
MTWACERSVEVPIAKWYLDQSPADKVLEVGNVLSHYFPVTHDVLDKFERGPGIINEDIVDFVPKKPYRLIISISTFEHIGFDDEDTEPSDKKIRSAIAACRKQLEPGGTLVITVPLGYNPSLDIMIRKGELKSSKEFYLKRTGRLNWESVPKDDAIGCSYMSPFPYANGILVAEFSSSNEPSSGNV